jgi:amino acid transporter
MSGEIKDPRRTIPRALPIAGVVIVSCYIIGTFAVLLAMPSSEVNTLQGLVEAGAVAAQKVGAGWIVVPLALLITLGNLGAASGFLSCAARIPFAVGIDRLLRPSSPEYTPSGARPMSPFSCKAGSAQSYAYSDRLELA